MLAAIDLSPQSARSPEISVTCCCARAFRSAPAAAQWFLERHAAVFHSNDNFMSALGAHNVRLN